jgi:hypothetical protein
LRKWGAESSETATDWINLARIRKNLRAVSGKDTILGRADFQNCEVHLDFADFKNIDYGDVNPTTLNLGSVFVHELLHVHTLLRDPGPIQAKSSTGVVVGIVNPPVALGIHSIRPDRL